MSEPTAAGNPSAFAKCIAFLSGKKTYIISVAGLLYAVGIHFWHWPNDPEIWGGLGFAGAMSLRAAITKLCVQIGVASLNPDDPLAVARARAAAAPVSLEFDDSRPGEEVTRSSPGPGVPVIFIAASLFLFSGCANMSDATRTKVTATDAALVASAKNFGAEFIASTAQSTTDALIKNDFKMSSADALRTLEGGAISAGLNQIFPLVKNLVATWLPQKPHWQTYSADVAAMVDAYVKAHPNDPNALNVALESVAQGLQTPPAK